LALGGWHKKFTLAARKDLGLGRRIWHVGKKPRAAWWQIWRAPDEWPGGWPPPDAKQLIEQARRDREARAESSNATADEPRTESPDADPNTAESTSGRRALPGMEAPRSLEG